MKCVTGILALAMSVIPLRAAASQQNLSALIGVDQHLGETVPLELTLTNEAGRRVKLGEYFEGKPVVLTLVYYDCSMLCPEILSSVARATKGMRLEPGEDFVALTVSFDPEEGPSKASARRRALVSRHGEDAAGAGWHFLTAEQEEIAMLTRAVGFRYVSDPDGEQFAHPSVVSVLTPGGALSRYLQGVDLAPRDLQLALIEASRGAIGRPLDRLLLYCYHYDPETGRYGLAVTRALRAGGALTVVALAVLFTALVRRERRAG